MSPEIQCSRDFCVAVSLLIQRILPHVSGRGKWKSLRDPSPRGNDSVALCENSWGAVGWCPVECGGVRGVVEAPKKVSAEAPGGTVLRRWATCSPVDTWISAKFS